MPDPIVHSGDAAAPAFERRWMGSQDDDVFGFARADAGSGVFLTQQEVTTLVWANFAARWVNGYPRVFYPGDARYYCAPVPEATTIIRNSLVDRKKYAAEGFDCDDFAYVFKAHFCQAGFVQGQRVFPYCVGIAWFANPAHALNWMINSDGVLRLIEPQTGKIVPLTDYKGCYLLMI